MIPRGERGRNLCDFEKGRNFLEEIKVLTIKLKKKDELNIMKIKAICFEIQL